MNIFFRELKSPEVISVIIKPSKESHPSPAGAPVEAFLLCSALRENLASWPELFNNKILHFFPREIFSFLLAIACFVSNPVSNVTSGRYRQRSLIVFDHKLHRVNTMLSIKK